MAAKAHLDRQAVPEKHQMAVSPEELEALAASNEALAERLVASAQTMRCAAAAQRAATKLPARRTRS